MADEEIVLAIVKCKYVETCLNMQDLVAMRSQNQWPEDPLTHMKDYFGNVRSPEWDVMEELHMQND